MIGSMEMNWLYGPKTRVAPGNPQPIYVRPVTIDIETVEEIAQLIELRIPESEVEIHLTGPMWTNDRIIPRAELSNLDWYDRRNLRLTARHNPTGMTFTQLNLQPDTELQFFVDHVPGDDPAGAANSLMREVAEKIANNGTPIFRWSRITRLLPYTALAILVVAWVITETTITMPISLHIAGWLVIAFAGFVAHTAATQAASRFATNVPGIRIRFESRIRTAERRADNRSNIKVSAIAALITAVISIPTTAVLTFLSSTS